MGTLLSAHFTSLFIAAIFGLGASACASAELLQNTVEVAGQRYDAQECVENALRNQPDPTLLRDAEATFTRACNAGEAGSCSVLGVMHEVGAGVTPDRDRAVAFYEGACQAHNLRACSNLGDLMLRDASVTRQPWRALTLLRTACGGGEGRACERVGRAYRDGENGKRDRLTAAAFFEKGCGDGDPRGCAELASEIVLRGNEVESAQRVPALLERACLGGHVDSCAWVADRGKIAQRGGPGAGSSAAMQSTWGTDATVTP
jgi:TPR repeat protein